MNDRGNILAYSPPEEDPRPLQPLAVAMWMSGWISGVMISGLCLIACWLTFSAEMLPLIPVMLLSSAAGALSDQPPLRHYCWGVFTGVVLLLGPIGAVYLAWWQF